MDPDYETHIYEYSINITTIKMEVNFPCKMKIQYNSVPLTTEISSNPSHKFTFNQQITIREQLQKQSFELQVSLVTEKGAKYTAGILKLFHNQLIRSEGERVVIALARCLDKEAFCELKVDKVLKSVISKRATFGGRQIPNKPIPLPTYQTQDIEDISLTNNRMPKSKGYNGLQGTRSQFQFPINNNGRNGRNSKHHNNQNNNILEWDQKSREIPHSYYQRNTSKSPNTRTAFNKSRIIAPKTTIHGNRQRERYVTELPEDIEAFNRDKLIQAQVYKEEYVKLKEKYKKEAETAKNQLNKRIDLQNSQNQIKLQAMKYKLKAQQFQRASNEKNIRIKELQNQLAVFQQKQMQIQYLKNQLNQKDHSIRVLQDTIRQISHENDQLKAITQNRYTQQLQKITQLKHELQSTKQKNQSRVNQLQKQLKNTHNDLNLLQKQIINLNNDLQQQRNNTQHLQNNLTQKSYELQKQLQHQRSLNQHNLQDLYCKLERIEKQLNDKEQAYKELNKQNEKYKTLVMKLEYDKKILTQDNESLKSEYHDVKIYKQKYAQIFRQHKLLIEDKKLIEKQLEKTISSKDYNLQEMNVQYHEQIQYYKKISRQMDQKAKSSANKIIQMEGQMDIIKNQSEKIRRNNQNLIKDLAQAKEKQKQTKKALKTKQQQILSLQAQYSTIRQKSKNVDQIFKLQTDKLKDDIDKLKTQLQNEYLKSTQLSQSNTEMAMQLSKLRIKLQFTEERLDKDTNSLKDRQIQMENLIKDYEAQVSSLEDTINLLRVDQKQLTVNLSKTEMDLLRSEQNSEKRQRQIKTLEQKLVNLQNFVKVKEQQINNLDYEREELEKKVNQLDNDFNLQKNDNSVLNNEKNKAQKIIQIYQEDLKKAKYDIQSLSSSLSEKQKQCEQQKNQLKSLREQIMKCDLKYSGIKKETDRFRQSLIESLNGSFLPIFESLPVRKQSNHEDSSMGNRIIQWLNGIDLQRNKKLITQSTTWTEIVSVIISQSKDIKLLLNRLFEQLKHLQRQTQRLTQQQNLYATKHQTSQFQLQRTIAELQEELSTLLTQKEQEVIKFDHMIQELNSTIKQKDNQINDLNQEMQELHFTLNSINMDYTQSNQNNAKKIAEMKKQKNQLQQKVQQISGECMEFEDMIERLKTQLEQSQVELLSTKGTVQQQAQQMQQMHEMITTNEATIDELKKSKKLLIEQISELELHLSSQTQIKTKTQSLLQDEEKKNQQLKQFTNNLMKQKQNAIKSDLNKAEQIIVLETTIIEHQRDKEILTEQNQRHKRTIDEQKEQLKTLTAKLKETQNQFNEQKHLKLKLQDKIKDKERQLAQQAQLIKKIQLKHEKLLQKSKSEKSSLESQLDEKHQQLNLRIQQSNQKLLLYEKTLHQKQFKILSLENNLSELEQQLLAKKNYIDKLQQEVSATSEQLQLLRVKIDQQVLAQQQLLDEIKQKEQNMFELSGKMYTLEMKIASKDTQMKNKLQELDNEWIDKYESISTEYEQRLQLIEKERDYFKNIIDEKDHQIKILKSQSRNLTQQQSTIKKTLQEKIKKLEEDRLQLFTLKTSEIQKLNEEHKKLNDLLRQKDSELRRITNQLDIARATIAKVEEKNKDFEDKIKNINKLYNAQLQQLKKKQISFKNYKEWVLNQQWAMEREVRKITQNFIKRFLQNLTLDEKTTTKLVEMIKNFENTVVDALTNKLQEQ